MNKATAIKAKRFFREYRCIEIIEKLGWHRIVLEPIRSIPGFHQVGKDTYYVQIKWCKENIPNIKGRRWRQGAFLQEHEFYFENLEDALHFKVTWR